LARRATSARAVTASIKPRTISSDGMSQPK
jgi:hypothetical protein